MIGVLQSSKEVQAMTNGRLGTVGLGLLGLAVWLSPVTAVESAKDAKKPDDAQRLAARIDHHINAKLAAGRIQPAPRSGDGEYFRRLCLDLNGRIPTVIEVRDFIDDAHDSRKDGISVAQQRYNWVNELLDREEGPDSDKRSPYADHFANVLRHLLLPETNNFQAGFFAASFEGWLRKHLKNNTGYDKMVRELLTAPVFGNQGFDGSATPTVFYQAAEFKPETLAANTSRLFLGHKLECAQCHDHPFAKWTKEQFWEYTAFFAGINPQRGENPNVREIEIPDIKKMKKKVAKAKFLDGSEPKWENGKAARVTLAEWITRPDNPYFARATVNKVWAYFFGIGLIDPVDEPSDDNPPSHPELLDELAREFMAHHFDLKFLIRAIVSSEAYQRTSASADPTHQNLRLYPRMAVRGMSPEQLFDSVAVAIEYKSPRTDPRQFNPNVAMTPRAQFLNKFSNEGRRSEMETSILQALFMMNGKFMTEAASIKHNKTLAYIADPPPPSKPDQKPVPIAKRVEQLFMITLSRLPTEAESARMVAYVDKGGRTGDRKKAFEDVFWALLNCGEFMLNH
jgi:hypothetical protein